MVGASAGMMELGRMIRLVAPRSTTVLIEGETGTGKEVVAKALHRLSARNSKSFTVLNCAAIPEALLEAELFGHTRGAFTGAVQSRTGRIEAAHGGTLFLDEIGEMPLALQAKMLRFLECGELQRVGDNETMRVDVRVIAATHQPLEKRSDEGTFRSGSLSSAGGVSGGGSGAAGEDGGCAGAGGPLSGDDGAGDAAEEDFGCGDGEVDGVWVAGECAGVDACAGARDRFWRGIGRRLMRRMSGCGRDVHGVRRDLFCGRSDGIEDSVAIRALSFGGRFCFGGFGDGNASLRARCSTCK